MATLVSNRLNLKEIIKQGNLTALEDIVLQGNGDRLLGETSSAPLVQEFLENLPNYLDQINEIHKAATRGSVREFQLLLDRSSLVLCRDPLGATPLHKAVLYGHQELSEHIVTNYDTNALEAKDNDGRTALHYAAGLSDDHNIYQMLLKHGAKSSAIDQKKKTADFYLRFPDELNLGHIMKRSQRLNANHAINLANRIKSKSPSRRKERSLSPTFTWNRYQTNLNNQNNIGDIDIDAEVELSSNDGSVISNASNLAKRSVSINQSDNLSNTPRMVVNSANVRRWIEENNTEMLEGAVLEGHGDKIREKASGVLKDLDNVGTHQYFEQTVPQIMSRIHHIHAAVSLGDLTRLQEGLEKKKDYILSKDHLGMTPLHKATIMGHVEVVQYILEKFPETINARDREGRTALHYSTATTNRNGSKIHKMLIRAGAETRVRDLHGKTADYYRVHLLSLPSNESLRGPINKINVSQINGKAAQPQKNGMLNEFKNRRITQPGVREKINNALHSGNAGQLHELLLDGYGQELLGRTSFGEEARRLLKSVPHCLETIRDLQEACINGNQATFARLLEENVQFARVRDSNSFTLLHLAVVGGHTQTVNYLVDKFPAQIGLKDNVNRTALHLAALTGNKDIYRRLTELGLDPRSFDQKGKTAEYYLRNNPAVSATELQELLLLSAPNGVGGPLQGGNRLSKLPKASSKLNHAASSDALASTQTVNMSTTNGGLSGASLKMSSKPVRLPALSRPSASKSDDEKTVSQAEQTEDLGETEKMLKDQNEESDDNQQEPTAPIEIKPNSAFEGYELTKQENEPITTNKQLVNGGETKSGGDDLDKPNSEPGSGSPEQVAAQLATKFSDSTITSIGDEEPEKLLTGGNTPDRVIVYSRGSAQSADSGSLWQQLEDDTSIDFTSTDKEPKLETSTNLSAGKKSINQINLIEDSNANENITAAIADDKEINTANELINEEDSIGTTNDGKVTELVDEKLQQTPQNGITNNVGALTDIAETSAEDQIELNDSSPDVSEIKAQIEAQIANNESDVDKKTAAQIESEGELIDLSRLPNSASDNIDSEKTTGVNDKTRKNVNVIPVVNGEVDTGLTTESHRSDKLMDENISIVSDSEDTGKAVDATQTTENVENVLSSSVEDNKLNEDGEDASNEDKVGQIIENVSEREEENGNSNTSVNPGTDRLNELIKHWLEDVDLLRLEHVVIAGQGDRLLSVSSNDKQVQDFLNLVPAYMEKIKKVHTAVAHGDIEQVQKILTRKRFALCRDKYGASPLHLAVLHGHVDVLIYIITQFPETVDGPDNDGRTPMHYAAVLPDKQIYQMLETANANTGQKDRFGYSPRQYSTNGKLSIRDLLIKYGNEQNSKQTDLWERPPTSEIISQLTPDSGSVPSTSETLGEASKVALNEIALNNPVIANNNNVEDDEPSSNGNKSVQILQIEPRQRYSIEMEDSTTADADAANVVDKNVKQTQMDESETPADPDKAEATINSNSMKDDTESHRAIENDVETSNNDKKSGEQVQTEKIISAAKAQRNVIDAQTDDKKRIKRMQTFDRGESKVPNNLQRQTSKSKALPGDDKMFQTMSDEFIRTLRNEKIRLQKSIDKQLSGADVIKLNGSNGSVIDAIQEARTAPNARIVNGESAAGYDLTQIKDEQGRTVLHLTAAKDQKRSTFYKMLQQASYLLPERDAKYRTIRDIAVLNGIKNNLQVIDQFILDRFIKEENDYLLMLMLEGYDNMLSVVDSEGNDVIAVLKRHNINSMEATIHTLAQLQKNRDELHTFIRHGYIEGVSNLIESDPQLVIAKSDRGRTSLHLAVLFGNQDIIECLINANHKSVNIPDNLGRTPLHYAMAMSKMEEIGRILIHCGANKTVRDVRMRTPTYYFVYKQEIRDIKREEQNLTI